ncbi:MAG: FG-GAP repeat protein [Phycisphaera sp.]|nr:MAG: FG-GAP repeat protein [Phycisphaera sp.]
MKLFHTTVFFIALHGLALGALAQPGGDCLAQRFRPDFQPRDLEFGVDVAISDEHLLIVDRFGGSLIYTFRRDPDTGDWALNHTVPGGSGGDIVLDGDRFISGDVQVDPAGGALIYEFVGGRWAMSAELSAGPDRSRTWGEHVAFVHGHAAIGNAGEDVLVFREGAEEWAFVEEIVSPDSEFERSDFGDALAMDERFLIVGAPGEDLTGNQNGAVYIYEWDADGRPALVQKLTPEPADVGPRLGTSLALQGNTLVVGARSLDTGGLENVGGAYVYRFEAGQWVLEQELLPEPLRPVAEFGWDVALEDDVIAVGAVSDHAGSGFGVGAAHLYRRSVAGPWAHAATVAVDISARDYGEAVDLGGGQLVVGCSESFFMGEEHGLADVYDLDCLLCAPDLDADGTLTIFDFLLFFNAFDDGSSEADFDGDGELTIFDFLAFQTAFDAGCE